MGEFSFTLGFVVLPLAFVDCSIRPFLSTPAISQISQPLSLILDSILEPDQWFPHSNISISLLCSFLSLTFISTLSVQLFIFSELVIDSQHVKVDFILIFIFGWFVEDSLVIFMRRKIALVELVAIGVRNSVTETLAA